MLTNWKIKTGIKLFKPGSHSREAEKCCNMHFGNYTIGIVWVYLQIRQKLTLSFAKHVFNRPTTHVHKCSSKQGWEKRHLRESWFT